MRLKVHNEYSDVFTRIGCFKGTFPQLVKDDAYACHMPSRHVAYMLQKPFAKELKRLQTPNTITTRSRQNG